MTTPRWLRSAGLVALTVVGLTAASPGSAVASDGSSQTGRERFEIRHAQTRPTLPVAATPGPMATREPVRSFVTRTGATLRLAGRDFRFSGSNMYWLALDDNVRDGAGQPTYPTPFRIDDAMATAQAQGGTVVRAWANTVGCARCIEPSLGHFNDAAFGSLDYAVWSAARHRQRLVLSLVDNWDYYHGSKLTYTRWRGLPESAFFSDPRVIADYRQFISHVVTHVNPLTGLAYRDDPTVLAWETGNEMWCQTCPGNAWDGSWTRQVAEHLKSVAPRQLVVDGHGTDPACQTHCLHEPSLDIAAVDLVDDHFYPMQLARLRSSSATAAAHGKGYLVGEYDWAGARGGAALADFLQAAQANPVSGDLLWAVIPHADRSGFIDHDDGFQLFFPGRTTEQVARSRQLVAHAAAMSGTSAAATLDLAPGRPALSSATRGGSGVALTWRGAAGAASYQVQRAEPGVSGWSTVADAVDDHRVVWGATWTDGSAAAHDATRSLRYRVRARSLTGVLGGWSIVVAAS